MKYLGADQKGHKFLGVALTVGASVAILTVVIVFSALLVDDIQPTTTTTTTTTTTPPTTTIAATTPTTTADKISAEGSFRVTTDEFSDSLLNKDSDEYKAMEDKYTNMVSSC